MKLQTFLSILIAILCAVRSEPARAKINKAQSQAEASEADLLLNQMKRLFPRNSLRASDARQNINLDPLEGYLSQLDNRLTALENGTDDGTDLSEDVELLKDQVKTFSGLLADFQHSRKEVETKVDQMETDFNDRFAALENAKDD